MRPNTTYAAMGVALYTLLSTTTALAADPDVAALRAELQSMRQTYESRINQLESKIQKLETQKPVAVASPAPAASSGKASSDNAFNPAIGIILNGKLSSFSNNDAGDIAGFAIGEEGGRSPQGAGVDESELNFSSNVDDKFFGSLTAAIVNEDGEAALELEEAFINTLPGTGLPQGLSLKFGRALWSFGYLNDHHAHTDDFADRPLPYRAFLNNAFNDDGAQLTYVLPTDVFIEVGGGAFRGDDYPFGASDGEAIGAWSAFAHIGDDIGDNQSWRLGASMLAGRNASRSGNEDNVVFEGNSELYGIDARYTWAPTGNAHEKEVTLQGEYLWRSEDGTYEDAAAGTGAVGFDGNQSGWYAQAVYKFLPQWRVGARYSLLDAAGVPLGLAGSALDASGNNPQAFALMGDWSNSEFSRIRLQYNREELTQDQDDNQFILQYIMAIGAHPAHAY